MDIYSRDRNPIVPNYLQVLRVQNHAGICLSYEATWQYLKQLTREANFTDIQRMAKLLREEGITTENPERKGHPFKDPLALGSQKVAEGRLEKYLTGCFEDDPDDKEAPAIEGEINFDYELFDVA